MLPVYFTAILFFFFAVLFDHFDELMGKTRKKCQESRTNDSPWWRDDGTAENCDNPINILGITIVQRFFPRNKERRMTLRSMFNPEQWGRKR